MSRVSVFDRSPTVTNYLSHVRMPCGHFHRSTSFYAQHRGDTHGSWRHVASPCYHEVMSLICFAFLSHAMWAPVHAVFFMMYHTLSPSATLVTRCSFRRVTRSRVRASNFEQKSKNSIIGPSQQVAGFIVRMELSSQEPQQPQLSSLAHNRIIGGSRVSLHDMPPRGSQWVCCHRKIDLFTNS